MRDDAPRTFSRIGGHVALDLLNTVEWRLDPQRAIEDLPDYESVLAWAQQSETSPATKSLTCSAWHPPSRGYQQLSTVDSSNSARRPTKPSSTIRPRPSMN